MGVDRSPRRHCHHPRRRSRRSARIPSCQEQQRFDKLRPERWSWRQQQQCGLCYRQGCWNRRWNWRWNRRRKNLDSHLLVGFGERDPRRCWHLCCRASARLGLGNEQGHRNVSVGPSPSTPSRPSRENPIPPLPMLTRSDCLQRQLAHPGEVDERGLVHCPGWS